MAEDIIKAVINRSINNYITCLFSHENWSKWDTSQSKHPLKGNYTHYTHIMQYHPLTCGCWRHLIYTSLYPHAGAVGACGTLWVPFGDRISGIQRASSRFPAVYFRAHLICSLTVVKERNIHQGALITIRAPGVRGWGGTYAGGCQGSPQWIWLEELWAPHDSVVTRQPQESVLWPRYGDCNSVCVWERQGGEVRGHRCWDFHLPPSSTFITNPSWAKWMLRHSKLTLRVTEAASAVCGITFHPNGMDGGLTTVTLTLLLYTTLPTLTRLWGGVGQDYRHSQSLLSLEKHSHLPVTMEHIKTLTC